MSKRFLIVEDHPLYAEALRLTISGSMSDVHILHATTLDEAKALLGEQKEIDLVLLDLWLPDTHGFDGLIELRRLFPMLPIVIVSAFANENVVEKAVVCGAAGFIPKSAGKEALLQGLTNVLAGELTVPSGCCPTNSAASLEATAPRAG